MTSKSNRANRSLPALVAVGGSLAALPAAALELGDLTVHSRLGQPLRASIAFALAPNEILNDYCIAMRPGKSLSGLPNVAPATLSVANGVIMLVGQKPVREPIVSAHVVVNCPYAPHISREYMLFVDPAGTVPEAPTTTHQTAVTAEPVEVTPAPVRVATVRKAPQTDIGKATRYQVQPGDSLSEIAQGIENRPIGLWSAVDAIFAANPDAFINNDPNRLKAGSWLTIPTFDGSAPILADNTNVIPPVSAEVSPALDSNAEMTAAADASVSVAATTAAETGPADMESSATLSVLDTNENLRPETAVVDENPFVQPESTTETVVIPDTQLEGPRTVSSSPNQPTAEIVTRTESTSGISWLAWLAGGGIALFVALLLFGRRSRSQLDPTPVVAEALTPQRRRTDVESGSDTEEMTAAGDVDFDLSSDSPTEENLALDADLVMGTGLDAGSEMDVAQDFGFAATTELDVELPFEPEASVDETDMLPPLNTDEHTILESEVLPSDDADEYDMSVIMDATKMPQPEDATQRDLKAVAVGPDEDTQVTDSYTITREIDYQILEQDYEDEMTATQALNEEIARAAAELANDVDGDESDDDATSMVRLATVTEIDVTTQLQAQNDDVSQLDDTGVNPAVAESQTADDSTAEMPAAEREEETVEMPLKSGKAS